MKHVAVARILTHSLRQWLNARNAKPTRPIRRTNRVQLALEQLEGRDAIGNMVGGPVIAAFGGQMLDPLERMADRAFVRQTRR